MNTALCIHPEADLRGGHSCSGRRGPWEVGPWGPLAKFWLAIAKSWLQFEFVGIFSWICMRNWCYQKPGFWAEAWFSAPNAPK